MLAFVDVETRVPLDHPLRTIKRFADAALTELSPLFDALYAADGQGRPSIPPARLYKKANGQAAKLSYLGHALMENRTGLLVDFAVTTATGTAECAAVPRFIRGLKERRFHPRTLGADKGYDTHDLVAQVRTAGV